MRRVLLGLLALALGPAAIVVGAQTRASGGELASMLERVGAAVERYFARAQTLICLENVSVQPLRWDMSPDFTPARRLTYELRVAWEPSADGGLPEATAERRLLKIGSRAPRPKDKPGCTDPQDASPEPLVFLLPAKQSENVFTFAGTTRVNGRAALMLDYRAREVGKVSASRKDQDEDCISIELPGRMRGRVWIDVETGDVLRLDERLSGMVDVTPPPSRRYHDRQMMTIERLDTSTVYHPVTFTNPDETIMLPKQISTMQIVRNSGSPRLRKTHVFTDYRRFITGGRIVQD
jgi:hypothetical protein